MSKSNDSFDVVFEGGGAKGVVFAGALRELDARGMKTRRLVGTSAGAITATLIAAGYSAEQIEAAIQEKTESGEPVFSTFMDIPEASSFGCTATFAASTRSSPLPQISSKERVT